MPLFGAPRGDLGNATIGARAGNIYGASINKASFRFIDEEVRSTNVIPFTFKISPATMSATKVWSRRPDAEEKSRQPPAPAGPIATPPSDV